MICFSLFDTAIGQCAIAWGAEGIVGLQLPEALPAATRRQMQERFPGAREAEPTRAAAQAQAAIVALLKGERRDLSSISLDMAAAPPFHRRVYEAARRIPRGETLSYGELAARIGAPGAARAVGQALARNPFPIVVPCHRVVAAGGRIGGFSANGGTGVKLRLLSIEGCPKAEPGLFEDCGAATSSRCG